MSFIQNKNLIEVPEGYKKMVLFLDAGMPGTEGYTAYLVPINETEKDLNDYAWQCAVDHAAMYGYYNKGDYYDMSEEELEADGIDLDDECYTEDIHGAFIDYDAKEHDDYLLFGSNKDFQWNSY